MYSEYYTSYKHVLLDLLFLKIQNISKSRQKIHNLRIFWKVCRFVLLTQEQEWVGESLNHKRSLVC